MLSDRWQPEATLNGTVEQWGEGAAWRMTTGEPAPARADVQLSRYRTMEQARQ
jgi:hypothetical protein